MIQVERLTKRYGDRLAVNELSFIARDGAVTGFVGPNGAGKSTTLRCIAGLDTPDAGTAHIDGQSYDRLLRPMTVLGAMLDPAWVHPGRTASAHLRWICAASSIAKQRCEEVLNLTGLTNVANDRVSSFSLGMRQRLGLAVSLIGDPKHLILDEPLNGLDPEGVRWMRTFLRAAAADGKCIVVSSHLLTELQLVADDVVLIAQGTLLDQAPVTDLVSRTGGTAATLRIEGAAGTAARVLREAGWCVTDGGDHLSVSGGGDFDDIGRACHSAGVAVLELSRQVHTLEDAVLGLTQDHVEYVSGGGQR
ncbi:ABC-2 type transport system ATP-binding protein [Yimella lutea]|uniref:ABC-2 type transport system ATP-binding protein n=1 Tax=Yimella lutea TaxID=587872 RepID=A0A542EGN5_9MICO|nr:ATP-binding cassette domain-containing protein [Yimella lutea]TQJ14475.1 ABC-2 type transport system ATP-binding protein [Yimella lutea]